MSDTIAHVNQASWAAEVAGSTVPVLVDFWAEWCGPCRALAPTLEQVAQEMTGRVKVVKVDVDQNQDIAAQYNVRSIPTLLLLKGGVVQMQAVGNMGKAALVQKIEAAL